MVWAATFLAPVRLLGNPPIAYGKAVALARHSTFLQRDLWRWANSYNLDPLIVTIPPAYSCSRDNREGVSSPPGVLDVGSVSQQIARGVSQVCTIDQ